MKTKTIILGITGSIAIYKACEISRLLIGDKFCVNVVMTKNATRLISPQVFASLIGGPVYCNEFVKSANWEIDDGSICELTTECDITGYGLKLTDGGLKIWETARFVADYVYVGEGNVYFVDEDAEVYIGDT